MYVLAFIRKKFQIELTTIYEHIQRQRESHEGSETERCNQFNQVCTCCIPEYLPQRKRGGGRGSVSHLIHSLKFSL